MKRAFSIWHSAFRNILTTFLLYAIFLLLNASVVSAQTFRYPVAELGFCRDAKECFLYCQIEENKAACWSYGKFILEEQVLGLTSDDDKHIEEEAKKRGITFPIAELSGCKSASECRSYCDNESNRNTCENFARSKKFGHYKEEGEMLEKAREKLGCDSFESCKNFCETPANRNKCESFGEEHAPPEFKQKKEEFLKKAKEGLGCTDFASCRNFCENPDNRERCMQFAQKNMPEEYQKRREEFENRGGQQSGPGGCNSEESCRKYCEDPAHKDECQRGGDQGERRGGPGNDQGNFGERFGPSGYPQGRQGNRQDGKFGERGGQGEGRGCSNEAECRSICEQNPDKCPGFKRHQEQEQQNRRFEEQRNFQQQQNSNQQQYQNYQRPPENFQPPQQNQQAPPQQNQQPPPQEQQQSQPQQTSGGSQPPPPSGGDAGSQPPPPPQ